MTRIAYSRIIRSVGSDLRELVAIVMEETNLFADAFQIIKEELLDGPSMMDDDSLCESLDYINDGTLSLLSRSTSTEETEDYDDNDNDSTHTASFSGEREAASLSSNSHIIISIVQSSTNHVSPILSPVDQELRRRLLNPQTYLEPLPKVDEVVYTVPLHMANQDDCDDLEIMVLYDDIQQERMQQDLRSYLQDFDIFKHTEEIADLLQNNGILDRLFHKFVPLEVSYTEFWMRYFFRCCRNRIERELSIQQNDVDGTTVTTSDDANSEALIEVAAAPSSSNKKSVMKMRYNWS